MWLQVFGDPTKGRLNCSYLHLRRIYLRGSQPLQSIVKNLLGFLVRTCLPGTLLLLTSCLTQLHDTRVQGRRSQHHVSVSDGRWHGTYVGPGGETWFETCGEGSRPVENLPIRSHVKLKMEDSVLIDIWSEQNFSPTRNIPIIWYLQLPMYHPFTFSKVVARNRIYQNSCVCRTQNYTSITNSEYTYNSLYTNETLQNFPNL